jgi:hypothetical protein
MSDPKEDLLSTQKTPVPQKTLKEVYGQPISNLLLSFAHFEKRTKKTSAVFALLHRKTRISEIMIVGIGGQNYVDTAMMGRQKAKELLCQMLDEACLDTDADEQRAKAYDKVMGRSRF